MEREDKIKHLSRLSRRLSLLRDSDFDIFKLREILYEEMLNEKKSENSYNFYVIKLQEVINGTFRKLDSSKKKNRKEELKDCIDDFKYYISRYNDHLNQDNSDSSNNGEPQEWERINLISFRDVIVKSFICFKDDFFSKKDSKLIEAILLFLKWNISSL